MVRSASFRSDCLHDSPTWAKLENTLGVECQGEAGSVPFSIVYLVAVEKESGIRISFTESLHQAIGQGRILSHPLWRRSPGRLLEVCTSTKTFLAFPFFLHLPDNLMTITFRELPNFSSGGFGRWQLN
jgi:hypothetical protein